MRHSERRLRVVASGGLADEDQIDLDRIFGGGVAPTETNSTIVRKTAMRRMQARGLILYDDMPGFLTRFEEEGWYVQLTILGERLYRESRGIPGEPVQQAG